jgi:hypothetical protein
MTKKTLGSIVTDLNKQQTPEMVPVLLKAAEMKSEYMDNLLEAVDRGCKMFPGNFYIEVSSKKERLLDRVYRDMFTPLLACPAPFWDQTVFRYNRFDGQIEYLWTLPGMNEAYYMAEHSKEIMKQPDHTGEKQLLGFVMMAVNGSLTKMVKKYNNEKEDSPLLIS